MKIGVSFLAGMGAALLCTRPFSPLPFPQPHSFRGAAGARSCTHVSIVLVAQPRAQFLDVLVAALLQSRVEAVVLRHLVLILLHLLLARLAKVLLILLLRQAAAIAGVCNHRNLGTCSRHMQPSDPRHMQQAYAAIAPTAYEAGAHAR